MKIHIKRVYDSWSPDDGFRVLVDRLWPRGVSKLKAKVDLWYKDIAPSNQLRAWFNHEAEKWPEFKERYYKELEQMPEIVNEFNRQLHGHTVVTLLYGAKDREHNQAIALNDFLKHRS